MNKLSLFRGLYRKKLSENVTLFVLFTLLAAVVSMVLFVQKNHAAMLQNQLARAGFGSDMGGLSKVFESTENILGVIAIAAVFIGAAGGLCLIGFRNQSVEKSLVMMRVFGMQKKDLAVKAFLDAAVYAFLSSCVGFYCGYLLFLHFSKRILQVDVIWTLVSLRSMAFFSLQSAGVFVETFILIAFLIFLGNLFIDLRMTERPFAQALYGRKGNGGKHNCGYILAVEMLGLLSYFLLVLHVKTGYLLAAGGTVLLLTAVLFFVFHIFFGRLTKKSRKHRKILKAGDLSFCFLCSRNTRDALLSVVISMGTVFLCLAANIIFNMGDVLRGALQDNLGYTALIRVDDFGQKELIRKRLDEEGIPYTYVYSKLMDYSQLKHMGNEAGKFWALVIDSQTDGNHHFFVPAGSFYTENYFAGRCGVRAGEDSDLFGHPTVCLGSREDNQYLSFVNYSFLVNKEDWELGIDDSWHAMFLINTPPAAEREIENMLSDLPCHMRSATELVGTIKEMLSDYLDILALVVGMAVLVTATVFYTVIRADLVHRGTEIYLYQVFGASRWKARSVLFYEYILIALLSSLAVSLAVTACGELYFYLGLQVHFPFSVPITAATTSLAVIFIFLCCCGAGYADARGRGAEVIRDE